MVFVLLVMGSFWVSSKKFVTIYGGHNSDDNESLALMSEHIQKTGF